MTSMLSYRLPEQDMQLVTGVAGATGAVAKDDGEVPAARRDERARPKFVRRR